MKVFAVLAMCVVAAHCAINPLNADQANLIKSTWGIVKNKEVDILYAIFQANPDIQARFPQFAGKDLNGLKDSAAFATHAGRIVGFLSEIIGLTGNSANAPALKTLINQLAATHKNRGIPQSQFNEFRTSLVAYLQQNVSWNDSTAAAWNQAIDNVYFVLFSALDGNPLN